MEKYYNLKEGYLSKLNNNNETLISAVTTDIDENHKTIQKEDKQSFEDFKTQYKGVIDIKCNQEYGNLEDKELWEDCAKELFLTSKNYLLQGDEYKVLSLEKKTENKSIKIETENNIQTESTDINVGDEYINDYGAKITILEPTKDGEYQFKVTNTKTGEEGTEVFATRSMRHVLDMNGYKKIENKNSTNNQLEESKINDIIANKGILSEIKKFDDKIIRDSFLNICELQQISEKNQIQVLQECRRISGKEPLTESEDNEYQYMLLDRLKTDCEYFLGNGNRNEKHLWAGSVEAQINEMKKIWNNLKEKPEWLTMEDINNYEKLMKNENANLVEAKENDLSKDLYQDEANRRILARLRHLDIYLEKLQDAIKNNDSNEITTNKSKIKSNIEYLIPALNIKGGVEGLIKYLTETDFDFENKFKEFAHLLQNFDKEMKTENDNNEKEPINIFSKDSEEYKRLQKVCDLLNEKTNENVEFFIEDVYFDYDQKWKWTTITTKDLITGTTWHTLNPRQQEEIINGKDVDNIINTILSGMLYKNFKINDKKTESMIDNYTLSQLRNVIDSEGNEFTLKISNRNTSNETKYLNIDREDLKNIYISLAGSDNDLIKLPSQENSEETKAFIQNQLDKSYKLNER